MARVEAVILAAGLSSRLSGTKLFMKYDGRTMLEHTLLNLLASDISGTTVVLGNLCEQAEKILAPYGINLVKNPEYARGISTSIKKGINCILGMPDVDAVLMQLADMPLVKTETINLLLLKYREKRGLIVAPMYGGKRGNPVLFDKRLFPLMLNVSGDVGARDIIRQYADQVCLVTVDDPGVLIDVDTMDDFQRLPGFLQSSQMKKDAGHSM